MPGIEELLGKQPMPSQQGTPEQGTNPLEALQNAGAGMSEQSNDGGRKMDEEVLKEMMMTGDNTNGLFEPNEEELLDEDEKAHEDVDEEAEVKSSGKVTEKGKKYIKLFQDELKDNPGEFMINTPEGQMTVKEAIKRGFNPETGEFDEAPEDKLNGMLEGLNDADKEGIQGLLDPRNANIAPADAAKFGLDPSNPMVQQPAASAVPGQEAMMQQGMPQGTPLPQEQAGAPQGGADIAALLGGGNQ